MFITSKKESYFMCNESHGKYQFTEKQARTLKDIDPLATAIMKDAILEWSLISEVA